MRRVAEVAVMVLIGAGAGSLLAHEGLEIGPEWLTAASAATMWVGIFLAMPLLSEKGD